MGGSSQKRSIKEKRQNIRHYCTKPIEFFVENRSFLGFIKNESRGGLFIETRGPFAVGQAITVTYPTPLGPDQKRTGKIVKLSPEGIGIQFSWPGYCK
ncbi:MAG: PilZ domain-containing protein [Desulfobacterales bacterium]|nr:MAG: PilZ domain-containing protein [Desulfobacterales bacterium]